MPERTFSCRQKGGSGLMMWGAFRLAASFRWSSSKSLSTRSSTQSYWTTLCCRTAKRNSTMGADSSRTCQPSFSGGYKGMLFSEGVDAIEWPARSPDLNPVENLWSILSAAVYEQARKSTRLMTSKRPSCMPGKTYR